MNKCIALIKKYTISIINMNNELTYLSSSCLFQASPTRPARPMSVDFKAGISQRAAEMRGRRESPVKQVAEPSVKSPEKVGPATRTLADRLAGMKQGWQNNEIAEKIKEQKERDMAMLQNRWKNGMPSDDPQEQVRPGTATLVRFETKEIN